MYIIQGKKKFSEQCKLKKYLVLKTTINVNSLSLHGFLEFNVKFRKGKRKKKM
jgi:hypothetical protein